MTSSQVILSHYIKSEQLLNHTIREKKELAAQNYQSARVDWLLFKNSQIAQVNRARVMDILDELIPTQKLYEDLYAV